MTTHEPGARGELAAAILAGGMARRFGGIEKAAIEIGGIRIVDRILDVLRQVAVEVFVVGHPSRIWAGHGLTVVGDAIHGAGALGGIYTAIEASPLQRTLIVGCDMPFLSVDLVRLLAAEDGDLVIPRTARGYEPLCAVYGKACAPPIRARIESGDLTAAGPLAGVRVVEIGPEKLTTCDRDGIVFVNVNTPHDYEQAEKWYHRITTNF